MAIVAITSIGELERIATQWDSFVIDRGTNPFFLSGYMKHFMGHSRMEGWRPLILVGMSGEAVVGIAAFKTRRTLGVKAAEFIVPASYSPDFLADPLHRQSFPMESLEFLIDKSGCQLAELVLPSHSPYVKVIKRWSSARRISYRELPPRRLMAHSILPVVDTWVDFTRARGRDFARHYTKIERKLREKGKPAIDSTGINRPEVVKRVLELDKKSWKEEWRKKKGDLIDLDLEMLLGYWNRSSKMGLEYCPRVWFLELDGEPIAYAIALRFKKTAFLIKTSYDSSLSKFYPGDYVQNIVLRDLFDSKRISLIDFHTRLPYHRRWTTLYLNRERIRLCRRSVLSAFLAMSDWNQASSRLSKAILYRIRIIDIP